MTAFCSFLSSNITTAANESICSVVLPYTAVIAWVQNWMYWLNWIVIIAWGHYSYRILSHTVTYCHILPLKMSTSNSYTKYSTWLHWLKEPLKTANWILIAIIHNNFQNDNNNKTRWHTNIKTMVVCNFTTIDGYENHQQKSNICQLSLAAVNDPHQQ